MRNHSISRNLFLTLFIVGLVNILAAYGFFFFTSTSLLKERSAEQMVSVRTLAAQKLTLYLEGLKDSSKEVIAIFEGDRRGGIRKISGKGEFLDRDLFSSMKVNSLYPVGNEEMVIKIPKQDGFVFKVFSGVKLNKLLGHKDGLGQSGEIYIVDQERKIRSTSRHATDKKSVRVVNESVTRGEKGDSGVHEVLDYRGVEVLSAYSPFVYDNLNYVLLSEIDKEEVLHPLKKIFPRILLICGILCCLTLAFAFLSARKILRLIDNMRQQINNFHIRLINTMEEEKKRISYNLHDGVGQILTALKWGISQNQPQNEMKELCDDAFREIRAISDNLMPAVLSEFGFFPAIKEYLSKQEKFYQIKTTYRYSEQLTTFTFHEGMDVNLYRMIQELIHNTVKHGHAQSISLVLLKENDNLQLRYEDDGSGMPDSSPMPRVLHYRCELMGAIAKRSESAPGLVYEFTIPLKRIFQ